MASPTDPRATAAHSSLTPTTVGRVLPPPPPRSGMPQAQAANILDAPQWMGSTPNGTLASDFSKVTDDIPFFVVSDAFVGCICCNQTSIGFDLVGHVTRDKHQKNMSSYVVPRDCHQVLTLPEATVAMRPLQQKAADKHTEQRNRKRNRDDAMAGASPPPSYSGMPPADGGGQA